MQNDILIYVFLPFMVIILGFAIIIATGKADQFILRNDQMRHLFHIKRIRIAIAALFALFAPLPLLILTFVENNTILIAILAGYGVIMLTYLILINTWCRREP